MLNMEKDFREFLDKAKSDRTPLMYEDRKRYAGYKTYGELNKGAIECYENSIMTFREAVNFISDNMNKAELIGDDKFEAWGDSAGYYVEKSFGNYYVVLDSETECLTAYANNPDPDEKYMAEDMVYSMTYGQLDKEKQELFKDMASYMKTICGVSPAT